MLGFGGQGKGLAVVAILLGLSAPASAGDEAVLYASLGDTTRSPIGWVEFCADNPGEWALHCHNLYHMASGMMTTLAGGLYGVPARSGSVGA